MAKPLELASAQDIFEWLMEYYGFNEQEAGTLANQLVSSPSRKLAVYTPFDPERAKVDAAYKKAWVDYGGQEQYQKDWDAYVLGFEDYADTKAKELFTAKRQGKEAEFFSRLTTEEAQEEEQGRQMQATAYHTDLTNRVQEQKEYERQKEWYERQPGAKGYAEITAPFLEQKATSGEFSPAMRQYYESQLPSIYAEAGMPAARQAWQAQRTKYLKEPMGVGGENWGQLSPQAFAETEGAHQGYEEELAQRAALQDPWESFLARYPFLQKYKALTPREKGYFSGEFRPRTRYLG